MERVREREWMERLSSHKCSSCGIAEVPGLLFEVMSQNVSMDLTGNEGPPGLNTAMPFPNPPPPPLPAPQQPSNMEAMLKAILANTDNQGKQLSKVSRDQEDIKEIASRALTTATQVKD